MSWTCPSCGRLFGRTKQSHECAPAMTLEEYFSTGPPFERPVFEAVMSYLDTIGGPFHVEPVSVGIFVKTHRSFLELRPLTKWVNLGYPGPEGWKKIRLRDPSDLDDAVKATLARAYVRNVSGA
ncbi:MAG TPA: hypothetical protein VM143_05490 [Acidimicrobiales bacterium]|nr:hypothetical protein [Acidimicrobiales bacterium]